MSTCGLTKVAVSEAGIDEPEIGVVEDVEGLRAHLKADVLGEPEVLQQAEIDLFHAWAQNASDSTGAEVSLGCGEGAGCEPLGLSLGQVKCGHLIGARRYVCVRVDHAQTAGIGACRAVCCA